MKLLYKPFGIILGILGGLVGKRVFDFIWTKIDDEDPPKPTTEEAQWGKILATAAAGFVALKFLFHIHFSLFGIGFWLGAILAIALAVLVWRPQTVAR
jgi:hypothetical protein